MWDFSFAVPSLLILSILLANYFLLKRLPLQVNLSFVWLLVIEAVVISSDIIGSLACNEYKSLPISVVYISNMVFFIFFALRGIAFFIFTFNYLGLNLAENRLQTFLWHVPIVINIIIILSTPWTWAIFYIDETGYHKGTFFHITTGGFLFYILISAYYAIRFKNVFKRKREMFGMAGYLLMLFIGLVLRSLLPQYLPMDTFCIMAILTINLLFMNPDFYIERRTRLFNTEGLRAYLDEINTSKYTQISAFVINHYQEAVEIYGANQMNRGISMIGAYLHQTFHDLLIFYYRSGRFIIISKPDVDMDDIHKKIEERFEAPWLSNDVELYLSASYAKVICNYENYSTDSILTVISNALDFVSNTECETYIIDECHFTITQENTRIKRALEKSIESNAVEIFLQPIVDAHTYELVGAESLCRIRDDEGNIIPPGKFISIAESNGRINQLGEQVFENTCKFIQQNSLQSLGLKWINVNLSTAQFMKNDLARTFENFVKNYGVEHSEIHLEITEAAIIDESIMRSRIEEIQKIGFVFSLDDYGTGYSNASRLKHFPFINVKIDMSLVWDYCNQPDLMLPMLIETLKAYGCSITAEGIETIEMAKAMTEIGCDYLQGWYFSKPIPPDEFVLKYRKS